MIVGSIVFGPLGPLAHQLHRSRQDEAVRGCAATLAVTTSNAQGCACMGPQPGQTKCPCLLRAESEQGRRMVKEGVVIDGVSYDLVRRLAPC